MTNSELISKTIEAELAASKVTKNELAKQLGLDRSNLRQRFNGRVPWNVNEIEVTARCVGLSMWQLFNLAEKREEIEKEKASGATDASSK